MDSVWMFGYDPAYTSVSMAPNSAACLRVLWLGSVEFYCAPVVQLKKGLQELKQEVTDIEKLKTAMSALTESGVQKLITDHNVPFYAG
eukprot:14537005-Alexandrium_andersonii.AAC.1